MQRILIIDDDEDIIETVGSLLKFEGYDVDFAITTEKGIEKLEENIPDLVLLDIMFPDKKTKGFDAAAIIKDLYADLPLFVFTAINREYAFDFSMDDIKADEFINKPVKLDRLLELIKKYT
ncbi:MAG: response regulator [Spirochaetia bacterium]|jgi:two-component system response regulator VicR|nr:response regulator [Spirochaetia bacterium]